ncbi:MAG: hypothetical protein Q4D02_03935 [Clostridia bacterium]|nr:hypothetical protein [Clostridia bacterium]
MKVKTIEYFKRMKENTKSANKLTPDGDKALFFLLPYNEPIEYETIINVISEHGKVIERMKSLVSKRLYKSNAYYGLNMILITRKDGEIKYHYELILSKKAYKVGTAMIWIQYVLKTKAYHEEVVGIRFGMRKNEKENHDWKYFIVLKEI